MRRLVALASAAILSTGCAQALRTIGADPGAALDRGIQRALEDPEKLYEDAKEKKEQLVEKYTLTPENEHYIGRAAAVKILADADYKYSDRDAIAQRRLEGLTRYVSNVGTLLIAQIGKDGAWPLAGYHFIVLERPEVNAFSTPGGFIFVTTGALALMGSEDELAAVLGHEIAHVSEGHASKMIQASLIGNAVFDVGAELAASAGVPSERLMGLFDKVIDTLVSTALDKGYGYSTEYEADGEGAKLAAGAGYDPGAMAAFLRKLPVESKGGFMTAHPTSEKRISKLSTARLSGGTSGVAARKARFAEAMRSLR